MASVICKPTFVHNAFSHWSDKSPERIRNCDWLRECTTNQQEFSECLGRLQFLWKKKVFFIAAFNKFVTERTHGDYSRLKSLVLARVALYLCICINVVVSTYTHRISARDVSKMKFSIPDVKFSFSSLRACWEDVRTHKRMSGFVYELQQQPPSATTDPGLNVAVWHVL